MANARSIVNQGLYLQRETIPGTAVTTAMRRYLGIMGTIGWEIEREVERAAGYKAPTGETETTRIGTADLEVRHDYNAMLPLLSGVFGAPVSAATATPTPSTIAYTHTFEINPKAADTLATFTAMWGDATHALQATNMAFHGMTFGVQRDELSLEANAILRAPVTGIALPTTGVTEVPMRTVRASTYDVWIDTTWAALGTTKALALYGTETEWGDKLEPDWLVNSALDSFSELMEAEEIDYTQSLIVGFDTAGVAQINDALNGKLKFVRVGATGADINGTDSYRIQVDTAVALTPTNVTKSPSSPATVVEFDGNMQVDATSGKFSRVVLTNTVATL